MPRLVDAVPDTLAAGHQSSSAEGWFAAGERAGYELNSRANVYLAHPASARRKPSRTSLNLSGCSSDHFGRHSESTGTRNHPDGSPGGRGVETRGG